MFAKDSNDRIEAEDFSVNENDNTARSRSKLQSLNCKMKKSLNFNLSWMNKRISICVFLLNLIIIKDVLQKKILN